MPIIDLLKIDAEGDELDILQGISEAHYSIIRQIVAEVHSDALLAEIQPLLSSRGYDVVADAGIALSQNIYPVSSSEFIALRDLVALQRKRL